MSSPSNLGGIAASHSDAELFDILIAPTTSGKEKNTIRTELTPVACWKINDVRFDFASSFVLGHAGAPFSVFGRADPTSDDAFNKCLSDHRSESIYAGLTHDGTRWEKLYKAVGPSEGLGLASIQHRLAALGENPGPLPGQ